MITRQRPPAGQSKSVEITTQGQQGEGTQIGSGHYYPYSHITGGMLYIMRPKSYTLLQTLKTVKFKAEGQNFTLSR
jgi:hypothetical protein